MCWMPLPDGDASHGGRARVAALSVVVISSDNLLLRFKGNDGPPMWFL
jgi:hypothetical protein